MGVVEQRDASHPQRGRQQPAVAVDPDVAGGGAGQPGEVFDAVFPGAQCAMGIADRRVEQLRDRVFDDLPRLAPDAFGGAPQVRQNAGNGAGFSAGRSVGGHRVRQTS